MDEDVIDSLIMLAESHPHLLSPDGWEQVVAQIGDDCTSGLCDYARNYLLQSDDEQLRALGNQLETAHNNYHKPTTPGLTW